MATVLISLDEYENMKDEIERLREAMMDMSFYITGHNWLKLKPKTTKTYDAYAALKGDE